MQILQAGTVVDQYRLIRPIGQGGFGTVWLAHTAILGAHVAVKVLNPAQPEAVERELSAVRTYKSMAVAGASAGLMPVEHVGVIDNQVFYVLPLADGLDDVAPEDPTWQPRTLAACLDRQRHASAWFTPDQVSAWLAPICGAAQILADAGLVHRDIKPDNILFLHGVPVLSDISLLRTDTLTVTSIGTPGYYAPSWYAETGGKLDMFSLAVTLFALLTGNSPDKLGRAAFRWPPQGEASLQPTVHKAWLHFHRVVLRATHENPAERYFTFTALAEDIGRGVDSKTERPDAESDRTQLILRPGARVFGRYTLTSILGEGGMGVVWRARDETLGDEVALKFLPDQVRRDSEAIRDLKRETKRCLSLTHENIVRIRTFEEDMHAAAIVMEYVPGKSLSALKAARPGACFDVADLAPLVPQLCAALDHAHLQAKVVHRGLKPANILVTDRGLLKVSDFGIARSLHDTRQTTNPRGTSGTLGYMGPQQLDGEKDEPAHDIYALGAMLYDLLAGKAPFYKGDIMSQIRSATPVPVAERRAELGNTGAPIPPEWESTILACLAKDPARRPPTAGDVAARLVRITTPPPINVGWWIAGACLVVAVGLYFTTRPASDSKPPVVSPTVVVSTPVPAGPPPAEPVTNPSTPHQAPVAKPIEPVALPPTAKSLEQQLIVNSLELKMLPFDIELWMSATLVRRRDFATFAASTNFSSANKIISVDRDGWQQITGSWKNPGFPQEDDHPVVGTSWDDAQAFCQWLTKMEVTNRRILPSQHYRLPTEEEWLKVARTRKGDFPWGGGLPPPASSGNFAGQEVLGSGDPWPAGWSSIAGYTDRYTRTAPVGTFESTPAGFSDIAGNALQWCEDIFEPDSTHRVVRGSSWADYQASHLRVDFRQGNAPDFRAATVGFRIVLSSKP